MILTIISVSILIVLSGICSYDAYRSKKKYAQVKKRCNECLEQYKQVKKEHNDYIDQLKKISL